MEVIIPASATDVILIPVVSKKKYITGWKRPMQSRESGSPFKSIFHIPRTRSAVIRKKAKKNRQLKSVNMEAETKAFRVNINASPNKTMVSSMQSTAKELVL